MTRVNPEELKRERMEDGAWNMSLTGNVLLGRKSVSVRELLRAVLENRSEVVGTCLDVGLVAGHTDDLVLSLEFLVEPAEVRLNVNSKTLEIKNLVLINVDNATIVL